MALFRCPRAFPTAGSERIGRLAQPLRDRGASVASFVVRHPTIADVDTRSPRLISAQYLTDIRPPARSRELTCGAVTF